MQLSQILEKKVPTQFLHKGRWYVDYNEYWFEADVFLPLWLLHVVLNVHY